MSAESMTFSYGHANLRGLQWGCAWMSRGKALAGGPLELALKEAFNGAAPR